MMRLFVIGAVAIAVALAFAVHTISFSSAQNGPLQPHRRLVLTPEGLVTPEIAAERAAFAARLKDALLACASAKGWDFSGLAPGRPSHFAASAIAYCYLSLPPEFLCEPRARASLFMAMRVYFGERDNALRYLGQVDAARARRRRISSSIDAEQAVAAEREAQSWVGDEEIGDKLAKLVKAGYLTADDFYEASVHADVVQSLGGITPGPNACRPAQR